MVLASGVLALRVFGATKVPMFGTTKVHRWGCVSACANWDPPILQATFSHGPDSVTIKGQTALDDTQRVAGWLTRCP
jgi:hypothetical protein